MTPSKPSRPKQSKPRPPSAFEKAIDEMRQPTTAFPNVSLRWLLSAGAVVVMGAMVCAWLALCLLYWQGSWQLLYHPSPTISRTPAATSLAFETIKFAATDTGTAQLTGWWIPNPNARLTILYLHGADGNLSDTVDTLTALHRNGLSIFAFDYRGYGESQVEDVPIRPSEKQLRQDAEWALSYLTLTRHIDARSIVIYGSGLGANLAAEVAADHSEAAGVILDQPLPDATAVVFNDSRSKLVPAHWMVKDRYDLAAPAAGLRTPSLWVIAQQKADHGPNPAVDLPSAYKLVPGQKTSAWLRSPVTSDPHFDETLRRWLDDLPAKSVN